MTHLLIIVLLIVFVPIAATNIMWLLSVVAKLLFNLIWIPILTVGVILGALDRAPGALRRGFRDFVVSGGAKELLYGVAICAAVTVILMPLFPS